MLTTSLTLSKVAAKWVRLFLKSLLISEETETDLVLLLQDVVAKSPSNSTLASDETETDLALLSLQPNIKIMYSYNNNNNGIPVSSLHSVSSLLQNTSTKITKAKLNE